MSSRVDNARDGNRTHTALSVARGGKCIRNFVFVSHTIYRHAHDPQDPLYDKAIESLRNQVRKSVHTRAHFRTTKLNVGTPKLNVGTAKLNSGTTQLNSGTT